MVFYNRNSLFFIKNFRKKEIIIINSNNKIVIKYYTP